MTAEIVAKLDAATEVHRKVFEEVRFLEGIVRTAPMSLCATLNAMIAERRKTGDVIAQRLSALEVALPAEAERYVEKDRSDPIVRG